MLTAARSLLCHGGPSKIKKFGGRRTPQMRHLAICYKGRKQDRGCARALQVTSACLYTLRTEANLLDPSRRQRDGMKLDRILSGMLRARRAQTNLLWPLAWPIDLDCGCAWRTEANVKRALAQF